MKFGARFGPLGMGLVVIRGLLAAWIVPIGPNEVTDVVATRFLPPLTVDYLGVVHPLGTDRLGRDVWARMAYGTRVSLAVGGLATLVSLALGVSVGSIAAIS